MDNGETPGLGLCHSDQLDAPAAVFTHCRRAHPQPARNIDVGHALPRQQHDLGVQPFGIRWFCATPRHTVIDIWRHVARLRRYRPDGELRQHPEVRFAMMSQHGSTASALGTSQHQPAKPPSRLICSILWY